MSPLTNGDALVRWVEAADLALDTPATADARREQFLALMARPESPGKLVHGVTYYLQQQTLMLRKLEREKLPDVEKVGTYRWEQKRELRAWWEEEADRFGAEHNDAVAMARAFCARDDAQVAKRKRAARPSADEVRAAIARDVLAATMPADVTEAA